MKESKPIYGFRNGNDCIGLIWETELGKIVTIEGKLDIKSNLQIRSVETCEDVDDIDLRNVLMSILPRKEEYNPVNERAKEILEKLKQEKATREKINQEEQCDNNTFNLNFTFNGIKLSSELDIDNIVKQVSNKLTESIKSLGINSKIRER